MQAARDRRAVQLEQGADPVEVQAVGVVQLEEEALAGLERGEGGRERGLVLAAIAQAKVVALGIAATAEDLGGVGDLDTMPALRAAKPERRAERHHTQPAGQVHSARVVADARDGPGSREEQLVAQVLTDVICERTGWIDLRDECGHAREEARLEERDGAGRTAAARAGQIEVASVHRGECRQRVLSSDEMRGEVTHELGRRPRARFPRGRNKALARRMPGRFVTGGRPARSTRDGSASANTFRETLAQAKRAV